MSLSALTGKRNRPVAIMIHDGYVWHGSVFAWKRGEWAIVEDTFTNGGNPLQLPEELTAWAAAHGARRVRVLIPCEPREVDLALSEEMESAEMHSAVALEVAEDDPDGVRVAMVREDRFRMGGSSGKILASIFPDEALASFREQCARKKVAFEGLGPLEAALLNYHARLSNHKRCLLLLPHGAFYAAPAAQGQPFTFTSSPVTFRQEDYERNPDRYERMGRRLQTHRGLPLVVYTVDSPDAEQQGLVAELAEKDADITFTGLREQVVPMARHAAWGRETGSLFNGVAFAGMRQAPRDPHRAGTWLCLLVVLASAAAMGWLSVRSHHRLAGARERQAAWNQLEEKRQALQKTAEATRQERDHRQAVTKALQDTRVLPDGLLEVLDVLRRQMPPYTRLTRLYQVEAPRYEEEAHRPGAAAQGSGEGEDKEDRTRLMAGLAAQELILEGTTFSQKSLTELGKVLGRALAGSGMHITPGRFERLEKPNELAFEYHICPRPKTE